MVSSLYWSSSNKSNFVSCNQFFELECAVDRAARRNGAPFEIIIVLSNTLDQLTVNTPPLVASCCERLWHAGDEAAVPESCCRQSSHSVALAGRSSKVTPRSGNTFAESEPPSLTIAARYSNACPRASRRSRRCDFPASTWTPVGVIDLPGGRYTGKVPRSSAARPSEFASYGC
jgi:hypothetical protein